MAATVLVVSLAGLAATLARAAAAPPPGDVEHDGTFHVLLTGFGPFLNTTQNPTEAVARHLSRVGCEHIHIAASIVSPAAFLDAGKARLRVCWHAQVLPVNRTGALWTTQHLLESASPGGTSPYHAVFHTGFEDSAKRLKLEVAAANLQAQDTGADGTSPAVAGAPRLLATTVNLGWLSLLDLQAHHPASAELLGGELWSRNPGGYYCNEVYFRTLHLIRSRLLKAITGALLPAMFVHMPREEESSTAMDADLLRHVVAHALFATYVAQQGQRPLEPAEAEQQAALLPAAGWPPAGLQAALSSSSILLANLALAALNCSAFLLGALWMGSPRSRWRKGSTLSLPLMNPDSALPE